MSGRSYTMKEMRTIVDYVNTRKAYGEIKGRKLWTEFACSNLTNRTWQSLKETFIKRILPDIHNPYYGLSTAEICSFKNGYDIDTRNKSKLDIETISDDSNKYGSKVQDNQTPSTSNNKEADNSTGEKTSSYVDARTRASTETIILDNCYETAEDIQRDLESPKNQNDKDNNERETPSKCLRDLITYAEPFTPMMQQILDDFSTEEELVEAELEILEKSDKPNEDTTGNENSIIEEDIQLNTKEVEKIIERDIEISEVVHCSDSIKIPLGQVSTAPENNSSDLIENDNVKDDAKKGDNITYSLDKKEKDKDFVDLTVDTVTPQNTNNSADTILPGNQEALKNKDETTEPSKIDDTSKDNSKKLSLTRNRSFSLDAKSDMEKKRKLGLNTKSVLLSETDDRCEKPLKLNVLVKDREKPSNVVKDIEENKVTEEIEENASQINPCLNSVSLYEEQFNNIKYIDSDSSDNLVINADVEVHNEKKDEKDSNVELDRQKDTEEKNKGSPKAPIKAADINDVVLLKSHSESEDTNDEEDGDEKVESKVKQVDKKEREKALANVFGFSSGVVSSSRKRRVSRPQRSPSFKDNESISSEWTSESDSEYVSPPRGRRNRYARKYLKPRSSRVMRLEEGGLFVMHGKRIYPLVKDGGIVKNYLTFSPESEPEEDSGYWKKKYKEERKKTEELKKLVEASKSIPVQDKPSVEGVKSRHSVPQSPPELITIPDEPKLVMPPEKPKKLAVKSNEKTLKIKFTKNNEELQVEGCWSQIHPVLSDVVQMFSKDPEPEKEAPASNLNDKVEADVRTALSIRSTPEDEESVRKKVEKMEEEIFKEIEELDKSEREQEESNEQEQNVNKRKRTARPRKASTALTSADSSSSPSRPKRAKAGKPEENQLAIESENVQQDDKTTDELENIAPQQDDKTTDELENIAPQQDGKTTDELEKTAPEKEVPKRKTKSPKKYDEESTNVSEKSKKIRKSSRKSVIPEPESTRPSIDEDSEVRYMLPPKKNRKSAGKTVRSSPNPNPTPENLTQNSIESSQGYQDSDPSPARERIMLKRRRKISLSTILHRTRQRRSVRRRSYPCISDDASSESSNLSFKLPAKNTSDSIKSDVYRSESYQLLMPLKKRPYTLEKIDELSPTCNPDVDDTNRLKIQDDSFDLKNSIGDAIDGGNTRSDENSSHISLPMSPELSIVENISINKELLDSIEDFPTINEMQANNEPSESIDNKYLISAVDVTMPLMEQDCDIKQSVSPNHNIQPATSESLLKRNCPVSIADGPSISDSLDSRLRNLLLESAKKMEVDMLESSKYLRIAAKENCDENVIKNSNDNKKSRAKKRCSTPHKRNSKKNSKMPEVDPVVEEECMEFCSYGGRKSCPPVILTEDVYGNEIDSITVENELGKKGRKKKDIIKVKILKPTKKQKKISPVKAAKKKSDDVTKISIYTDSGINETGSGLAGSMFLHDSDDSIDLIHNHSETCLQTKECFLDSVEFIERDTSVISIHSDSENLMMCMPPGVFCNNAQDGVNFNREKIFNSQSTGETVYLSPLGSDLSGNSLITEDLSDENDVPNRRTNKWYLLSEDETTNTNQMPGFGANLMQIFSRTAVPDLSTITENSKENDSRKPTLDRSDGD